MYLPNELFLPTVNLDKIEQIVQIDTAILTPVIFEDRAYNRLESL